MEARSMAVHRSRVILPGLGFGGRCDVMESGRRVSAVIAAAKIATTKYRNFREIKYDCT
jgi:hypothetical protein